MFSSSCPFASIPRAIVYFTILAPAFAFVAAFSSLFSTSMASSPLPLTTASTQFSSAASPSSSSPISSALRPPLDWRVKRSVWSLGVRLGYHGKISHCMCRHFYAVLQQIDQWYSASREGLEAAARLGRSDGSGGCRNTTIQLSCLATRATSARRSSSSSESNHNRM
jgi:hypothetical protein